MDSRLIVEALLFEWHGRAKLEAARSPYGEYVFYRNGQLAGSIQKFRARGATGSLDGLFVARSLQRSGMGHAILQHLFDTNPGVDVLHLSSSRDGLNLYHRSGGTRERGGLRNFRIARERFKPSPWKFKTISWAEAERRGGYQVPDYKYRRP